MVLCRRPGTGSRIGLGFTEGAAGREPALGASDHRGLSSAAITIYRNTQKLLVHDICIYRATKQIDAKSV